MGADDEEIDCPVCDRRIGPETAVCPGCGTDFTLSGMDELKEVIQDLDRPTPAVPEPADGATAPAEGTDEPAEDERKGILSKWFKRR